MRSLADRFLWFIPPRWLCRIFGHCADCQEIADETGIECHWCFDYDNLRRVK